MPVRRKSYRRPIRHRRIYRKKYGVATKRYVAKAIQRTQDLKFKDTTVGIQALSTAPQNVLINSIPQGTSSSQRVGAKIIVRSIQFNGCVRTINTTSPSQQVKVALCLDRQNYGNTAASATLLWTNVFNTTAVESLRNLNMAKRYKVLWQRRYAISPQSAGDDAFNIKYYRRCYIPVEYNSDSTGGAFTDFLKGILFIQCAGTEPTNGCNVVGYVRIRYTDA